MEEARIFVNDTESQCNATRNTNLRWEMRAVIAIITGCLSLYWLHAYALSNDEIWFYYIIKHLFIPKVVLLIDILVKFVYKECHKIIQYDNDLYLCNNCKIKFNEDTIKCPNCGSLMISKMKENDYLA